jgi:hypothetical protein
VHLEDGGEELLVVKPPLLGHAGFLEELTDEPIGSLVLELIPPRLGHD